MTNSNAFFSGRRKHTIAIAPLFYTLLLKCEFDYCVLRVPPRRGITSTQHHSLHMSSGGRRHAQECCCCRKAFSVPCILTDNYNLNKMRNRKLVICRKENYSLLLEKISEITVFWTKKNNNFLYSHSAPLAWGQKFLSYS